MQKSKLLNWIKEEDKMLEKKKIQIRKRESSPGQAMDLHDVACQQVFILKRLLPFVNGAE